MSKIIKVSTDLEVTVHDYPEGMLETQNRQLCELIGDGCDMVENVMPKRLYRELGHTTTVLREALNSLSRIWKGSKGNSKVLYRWHCAGRSNKSRPAHCCTDRKSRLQASRIINRRNKRL